MLKLYNSLGRKLMRFYPLKKGTVRMYTCGPTVWNYAHLGNLRTFVFYDLLRRYLKFKGYKVEHVMNITDVEDKIIKAVKQEKRDLKELTSFYEKELMKDLKALNVERFEYYPRATEHISDIVELIKKLIDRGYAYKAADNSVYFSIKKFKKYGQLSGIKAEELKPGARVSQDSYEKTDIKDFALWKAWDEEDGNVFWETELGKGRPGWHIECSAMAMKYLGPTIDIHAGGKDLKFPHHENEIAQSEAATGKRFVRYWLHTEFLNISGEEMHKSKGNYVTLRDKTSEGWDPLTIRYFFISSHYRTPLNLTDSALREAEASRKRILEFVYRLYFVVSNKSSGKATRILIDFLKKFGEGMDEDLNVPKALAALFSLIRDVNSLIDINDISRLESRKILEALRKVDSVLGVIVDFPESLPADITEKIARRDKARKAGDFNEADRIRKELYELGIILEDTKIGTIWKKRSIKENIPAKTI